MANNSFRPSRSLEMALRPSMLLVFVVLAQVWFPPMAQSQDREGAVLRGIVTLDSPVSAGTISIFNGSDLLEAEPRGPFANGTFEINLDPQVAALLPNADLRVLVEVQGPDTRVGNSSPLTLSAVLHHFDPASQVVFINPVTTVVCAYLDDNTDLTWEEAASKVAGVLGVSTSTTFQSTHMLDFDSKAFIAASGARGGFDSYVHAVGRLADAGGSVNYAKGPAAIQAAAPDAPGSAQTTGTVAVAANRKGGAAAPDFLKLVTSVARGVAKDAFQNNAGQELGGWIIDTIVGGLTPAKEDELDQVSKKLDGISTQISELGKQISREIADLKETVKAAQNFIVYQQVALATNPAVVSLNGMEQRLYFLALAGAAGEAHPDLAAALGSDIFSKAQDDLVTIQNGLAGINQTPGMISQWAKVMLDADPNLRVPFPTFFTNDYLASATAQYQYYLGAQFTGFNLRIEYAHSIIRNGPVLAKQIISDAITSYNSNFNTNMKLVAANSHVSIDGTNYFPSITLPSDDLVADSRSGFVWLRTEACAQNQAPPCNFYVPNMAGFGNPGIPLASAFLETFSVGGVEDFSLPSRDDWTNLFAGRTGGSADFWQWLNQRGFKLSSTKGYDWTSDSGPCHLLAGQPITPYAVALDTFGQNSTPQFFNAELKLVYPMTPTVVAITAARVVPHVLDLDLLYAENANVLGAETQP